MCAHAQVFPQMAPVSIRPLIPSSQFYLASGTVSLDIALRKVLVIFDHDVNSYKLPRGRKDWGEPLTATATRETFEETGYHTTLLPVPLSTRASQPASALSDPSHPYHAEAKAARYIEEGYTLLANSARLTEPFALMQHYQSDGTLAVVLWYVGVADSTVQPVSGTQMEGENYEARWVAYDEAPGLMVNSVYAEVVKGALVLAEAAQQTVTSTAH
ncbi:hypothetical protein QBC34DRAFT_167189 [Podospora aff. communis PSN243]|uniref:Nudix hydrolase domain-containing protein n=1 Tax=Podospora aff. communis PSN243 TaxID=3040156 RepID=A0AAV9GA89_9PEZI|nr:hypothetical protein QBC34DRAFT_167189 [Podospora aff. communis PSN243]